MQGDLLPFKQRYRGTAGACSNLILVQIIGLFTVNCTTDSNELKRLEPYFYELCNNNQIKCYVNPKRKIVILFEDDIVSIAGVNVKSIEKLSDDSGININYV